MNGGLDCEECRETLEGDTPCNECNKPKYIHPENVLSWKIWNICNLFERNYSLVGIETIKSTAVLKIVKEYDGDERDFEKVLWIEQQLYPELTKRGK